MDPINRRTMIWKRLPFLAFWTAVVLLVFGTARAQQYQIVDIKVTGTVNASEQTVKNVAALRIGSELTPTDLQDAVKNLYAKGLFKDISIDVSPGATGVIVTIAVSEYPKLTAISY